MKPLVFVHVRKVAGTSIKTMLSLMEVPFLVADEFPKDLIGSYVTFGVSRDPYDRVISAWKYCASTRNRSLEDALRDPPKPTDKQPGLTEGHDYRHFTKLQADFLYSEDRTKRVTHILRFERLQHDLNKFCDLYSIPRLILPRENVGSHRRGHIGSATAGGYPPSMLTQQQKDLIYEAYYDDFNLLGYPR